MLAPNGWARLDKQCDYRCLIGFIYSSHYIYPSELKCFVFESLDNQPLFLLHVLDKVSSTLSHYNPSKFL